MTGAELELETIYISESTQIIFQDVGLDEII